MTDENPRGGMITMRHRRGIRQTQLNIKFIKEAHHAKPNPTS